MKIGANYIFVVITDCEAYKASCNVTQCLNYLRCTIVVNRFFSTEICDVSRLSATLKKM